MSKRFWGVVVVALLGASVAIVLWVSLTSQLIEGYNKRVAQASWDRGYALCTYQHKVKQLGLEEEAIGLKAPKSDPNPAMYVAGHLQCLADIKEKVNEES